MIEDYNKYKIRAANMDGDIRGDRRFIMATWVASYRQSCKWLTHRDYARLYNRAVDHELSKEIVKCWVVCAIDCDEQLFGWLCGYENKPTLHYIYIKPAMRMLGLGSWMVDDFAKYHQMTPDGLTYTNFTSVFLALCPPVDVGKFNPSLFSV